MIRKFPLAMLLFAMTMPGASPAKTSIIPAVPTISYSDAADILVQAPVVANITIGKAMKLRGDLAAGVPEGMTRYLVTAKVNSLLRGEQGIPERIEYLFDLPANQQPALKKQKFLVGLTLSPGRPGMARLVSGQAQMRWTPDLDRIARSILVELLAPGAAPAITGISAAFHVKGSLPGESETQIFLKTATKAPVSITILRRPSEAPRWAVALGEMVDDAAAPPARETLLWYRLACALPEQLPAGVTAELSTETASAAANDYQLVRAALGPCGRTLP